MPTEDLESLFRLQELEVRLGALEGRRKRAPEAVILKELEERAAKFEKLEVAVRRRLQGAERDLRAKELLLASAEEGRKTTEAKLYSGETTHAKELKQLEARHGSLTREVATLEAQVIESMEQVEELKAQLAKVAAGREKGARQLEVARQRLAHREAEWDMEADMLRSESDALRQTIDRSLLSAYDRRKSLTNGAPIAVVRQGVCGGCRMELPASVRSGYGRALLTCERCDRMLYWPG